MSTPLNEDKIYEIALNQIPKIGPALFRSIIAYAGSARNFFELPLGKAGKIPRIGNKLKEIRENKSSYLRTAEKIAHDCLKKNILITTFSDPTFPKRLKSIEDCPMVLYSKGNIDFNPSRTVAIVGTRNATDYGRSICRKIVEDLSPYGPQLISGLAYGIDIEAHRAALHNNISTSGILGSSVDQIYPSVHKSTAIAMCETGGVISEYPPGTAMHPHNFPQRNRIIAGLADAIIVVEAAQKGGALITAEIAYSYNKEVFAVPGNLQSPYSEGCNNLIRSMKASIYTGPKDLEEALSWSKENLTENKKTKIDYSAVSEEERKILRLLEEKKQLEIDQLAFLLEMPISTLASKLLSLEFEGLVKSLPGKKYQLQ